MNQDDFSRYLNEPVRRDLHKDWKKESFLWQKAREQEQAAKVAEAEHKILKAEMAIAESEKRIMDYLAKHQQMQNPRPATLLERLENVAPGYGARLEKYLEHLKMGGVPLPKSTAKGFFPTTASMAPMGDPPPPVQPSFPPVQEMLEVLKERAWNKMREWERMVVTRLDKRYLRTQQIKDPELEVIQQLYRKHCKV